MIATDWLAVGTLKYFFPFLIFCPTTAGFTTAGCHCVPAYWNNPHWEDGIFPISSRFPRWAEWCHLEALCWFWLSSQRISIPTHFIGFYFASYLIWVPRARRSCSRGQSGVASYFLRSFLVAFRAFSWFHLFSLNFIGARRWFFTNPGSLGSLNFLLMPVVQSLVLIISAGSRCAYKVLGFLDCDEIFGKSRKYHWWMCLRG